MKGVKTKLFLPIVLILGLCMLLASGCSSPGSDGSGISVSVKITSTDKVLLDSQVQVSENEQNAGRAVKNACQEKKMSYTQSDGMYISFDGINSEETEGWLFYLNNELPDTGADDTPIKEGDVVEFRYVNYDEAFAK